MAKFYLETYGCKLNQADSEMIQGLMLDKFEKSSPDEADIVIINSCGVIGKTQRKIEKRIKELKKKGKKILLAGCLPLISRKTVDFVDGAIGPHNILKIKKAAEEVLKGKKPIYLQKRKIDKARYCRIKIKPKNSSIVVIPIAEGCLGECSYCAAKIARGKLKSFSIENILKEINLALSLGFKEIHLTSQDSGCFGLDRGRYELPKLLKEISKIKGEFRVRLGMGNPQHFKNILKPLISIYKSEKFYKYLHIPVQSGSDKVLQDMKRRYRVKDFIKVIEEFREHFPEMMIVTDIIVGYPTEAEIEFQKTINLIEKIKPRIVNITKFSKRPETEAFKLKDLPDKVKTERSRILSEICEKIKIEDSKKFVGRIEKVLITKKGKNNTLLARPSHFRAVILEEGKVGEFLEAKIIKAKPNYLIGKVVQ
jgi:MiaB-like tRNA modifying enzyme